MRGRRIGMVTLVAMLGVAAPAAFAQDDDEAGMKRRTIGEGQPSEALPPPASDDDPRPQPARPVDVPRPGITRQAGVGGTQAYGRAGVLELGGSAGFGAASGYTRFELSPSIGYFVSDNFELSLLTALNYFSVDEELSGGSTSATELRAMIEPSYHLPLSDVLFGFVGVGAGVNYLTGNDAGFAWQPRLGANIMVGRSGVLTPAVTLTYSTVEALRTEAGTLLAVQTTFGLNIGYTAMW